MIVVKNVRKIRHRVNKEALREVVKHYAKTKQNILVVFDKRLSAHRGLYSFNTKKKLHIIQLGYHNESQYVLKDVISTTLHEVKHLNQKMKMGRSFYYNKNEKSIEDEARDYEEKYMDVAFSYYKKMLKK